MKRLVVILAAGFVLVNLLAVFFPQTIGMETTPSWTSSGDNQVYACYGYSVSSAGDVNGDGYDDVIVGATYYWTANSYAGKAYLYLGSAAGLSSTPSWTSSGDDQAGALYGKSVSSAGDVNGDGYDDVIIGADYYDTANSDAGKAYLYLGSATGLSSTPSWTSSGDDQTGAGYGCSVSSADDVNGDGYDDVIIGAYFYDTGSTNAGKVYLYLGSAAGLSPVPSWNSSGDDQAYALYGNSVSSAGDVNDDGYDDVIVGADYYDTANSSAGKAYLYLGSAAGLSPVPSWNSSGDDQASALYGNSVSSAGDVNDDGVDDSVVGAPYYDTLTPNADAGKAYLYLGVDTTPPATPTGLTVTDVPNDEGGALNITWNENAEPDLDHYTLYSNKTGPLAVVAEIPPGIEYYEDTGLTEGTRYYYNISASDDASNESPQSATASGVPADNLPPAIPTGIAVTSLRSGDLNITWNLNIDDTQTYSIYSNKTGTWTLLENVTHPQYWYTDTGLTGGIAYYYNISAWDEASLESPKSEVVHGVSSPMGAISGTVKDKDGNPIEVATVTIYESGMTTNPVASTTTNNNGEYSVDLLPGTYDVKIEKSGYDVQWEKDVEVTADQTTTTDLILPVTTDILRDYWWMIFLVLLIIILILITIIVTLIVKKKKAVEEAEGERESEEETVEEHEMKEKAEIEEEKSG